MTRRARGLVAVALVALLGSTAATTAPAAGPSTPAPPAEGRRVLVVAIPGLTWADVEHPALASLRELLDHSAIASVATRVSRTIPDPGEAYLTMGTGTRAVAPPAVAGLVLEADESFGPGTAAEEHARQQGFQSSAELVSLSWSLLAEANKAGEFDGTIGALGDALRAAGIGRGVVANADGSDPLVPAEPIHREAALTLADSHGTVDCGALGQEVLADDPAAPFGAGLDPAVVLETVDRCLTADSVVLVEASDLRRANTFRRRASVIQADATWSRALASTDWLLAQLMDRVDLSRDAVVVVAPTTQPARGLGILGIRAAEVAPGLLTSGNTRRAGYVMLTDLAPTIAHLAGVEMDPGGIEGRVMERRRGEGTALARREGLADAEEAARFRDRLVDPVVITFVFAVGLLAVLATVVLALGWRWARRVAEGVSLALLALPSLTYLAGLLPFHDWGPAAFWGFLIGGSAAVGAGALLLRGRWLHPLIALYGLMALVVAVSVVLLGSRLQVSTVFGDSPIVAGRFTGINNVTFALFVAAGIALVTIVVHSVPGPRGHQLMVVLLGAVLLVVAVPMWGADIGGALAGLPALVVVAGGLGHWRIRWRTLALVALATVVLVLGFGFLDLTRPSADRSHLGRLLESIDSDGSSALTTVVERKALANLRSLTGSPWRFLFGPVALAAALVAWRARARAQAVVAALPPLRDVWPGFLVAAALGYALNDSGIAVPAAMVAFVVPGLVYLACRIEPEWSP